MSAQEIVIPYTPRPHQLTVHRCRSRFVVCVAHRRAGKSLMFVQSCIRAALMQTRAPAPRVYYVGPTFKQTKRVAFDYLARFSRYVPGAKVNKSDLAVEFPNGGRVQLLGSDNVDSLRGIYTTHVCLDEAGLLNPRLWSEVIYPTTADYEGTAWIGGTPNGPTFLKRIFERAQVTPGWSAFQFKASETGVIPERELAIARANMDADEYRREWEADLNIAPKGAFYGEAMNAARNAGRLTFVPFDPALDTTVAVDLGVRDAFVAVVAQLHKMAGVYRIVDCREYTNKGLPEIVRDLRASFPAFRMIVPHDARVRELGSGKARIEVLRELRVDFEIAPNLPIMDGIDATRSLLGSCVFDKEKCEALTDALTIYSAEWDDARQVYSDKPRHDYASHYADAMRYLAVARNANARTDWSKDLGEVAQAMQTRRQGIRGRT